MPVCASAAEKGPQNCILKKSANLLRWCQNQNGCGRAAPGCSRECEGKILNQCRKLLTALLTAGAVSLSVGMPAHAQETQTHVREMPVYAQETQAYGQEMPAQAQETPYCGFVQTEQGVMWRNADGTFLKDSWLDAAGLKYHLDRDGYVQVGPAEVDGKIYYLFPGGMITSGWLQIGDGIYYFQADGTMAVSTVVDGFVLGSDGRLLAAALEERAGEEQGLEEMSELQRRVCDIIAAVTTPDMSSEQKLRACYQYVMDSSRYKRDVETPSGDWTGRYAQEILSTGRGNCYRYASGFSYLAKGLGYETRVVTGTVRSTKGGQTPHGWTEVYINGGWYVFDAVMEDSRHVDMFGRTYEDYPYAPLLREAEWDVEF